MPVAETGGSTPVETVQSEIGTETPPAGGGDDDAPFWPDETSEVAFLQEAKDKGDVPAAVTAVPGRAAEAPEPTGKLPPLDELVKRIPAEVRDTLEELFRAKFVSVKRVPKKAFKA